MATIVATMGCDVPAGSPNSTVQSSSEDGFANSQSAARCATRIDDILAEKQRRAKALAHDTDPGSSRANLMNDSVGKVGSSAYPVDLVVDTNQLTFFHGTGSAAAIAILREGVREDHFKKISAFALGDEILHAVLATLHLASTDAWQVPFKVQTDRSLL